MLSICLRFTAGSLALALGLGAAGPSASASTSLSGQANRPQAMAADWLAACNAPESAQSLGAKTTGLKPADTSSPSTVLPAQAVWLDSATLIWPALPQPLARTDKLRLLSFAQAGTPADALVRLGQVATGWTSAYRLGAQAGPMPAEQARRFGWLVAGGQEASGAPAAPKRQQTNEPQRWRLPAAASAALQDGRLWREPTLLVLEDAAGRVKAVSRLQTAAALDQHYAPAALAWADAQAEPGEAFGAEVLALQSPARPGQAFATRFALWAPSARAVALCIYPQALAPASRVVTMSMDSASGIWHKRLAEDLSGQFYTWLVDVWVPGQGWVRNRVTDPYSRSLSADGRRSWIGRLDAPATQPEAWAADRAPATVQAATDLVVYELHVRDFSRDDASVPASRRGGYLAFTESASHGMRHLRALAQAGLTDVHLLPVFDYGSVPERGCAVPAVEAPAQRDSRAPQATIEPVKEHDCFNWGYDPVHYSAPEGSFASNPDDAPGRLRELRSMVMALHQAGLRVGMDVVYNHTFAAGQHDKSVLDRIVPGYYHRLNAQGEVERSTCCDNTATEHKMMARLMSDSLLRWAKHHHFDSFRFDLMGHQPRQVMEAMKARLKRELGREIHFIGEGWNFGEVADGRRFVQASQLSLNGSGIGTFSDRGRDALRGGGAGDSGAALITRQGWLSGLHYLPNEAVVAADQAAVAVPAGSSPSAHDRRAELLRAADLVRVGLAGTLRDYPMQTAGGATRQLSAMDYAGQPAGYASEPAEVVNYVENHDNQTLFDGLTMKLPRSLPASERARIQTLGAAVVAFSQGIAYFHAGQDLLRSKNLDRNSYNSGDWFNRVDWSGQTNYFGTGLPPESDNGRDWPLMAPLLADPALAPTPADIAFARNAFLDLLKIRASTPLLRLRTAAEVKAQLRLLNTGPNQEPTVLAGHLRRAAASGSTSGKTPDPTAGGDFAELAYFINVSPQAQTLTLPELQRSEGPDWQLHPVYLAPQAADLRPRQARISTATGQVQIPPRTAVVWVR